MAKVRKRWGGCGNSHREGLEEKAGVGRPCSKDAGPHNTKVNPLNSVGFLSHAQDVVYGRDGGMWYARTLRMYMWMRVSGMRKLRDQDLGGEHCTSWDWKVTRKLKQYRPQ